jgi:hypothetical protein
MKTDHARTQETLASLDKSAHARPGGGIGPRVWYPVEAIHLWPA